MGLMTTLQNTVNTGATAPTAKPITEGVKLAATTQDSTSTGLFGFLDQLGAKAGNVAGRAVDTLADNWIDDLDERNSSAAKTADETPVGGGAALSGTPINTAQQSFIDKYKTPLMIGGGVLVLLSVVMLARK